MERVSEATNSIVIPGRAARREPGIHNPGAAEYGFRARRFAASRNDKRKCAARTMEFAYMKIESRPHTQASCAGKRREAPS